MDAERARHVRSTAGFLGPVPVDVEIPEFAVGPGALLQMSLVIPIAVSMAAAFALSLPIAWLYTWTRPGKAYSPSFAQTLVILPIAISLVVFLVKDSLPLAFSLAGIVAAVRFRTSLSDPMHAIYMFVAIGIGLAAGVQLLPVALVGSWCFVAAVLLVWRRSLGVDPPLLVGWQLVPAGATSGSLDRGRRQGRESADARSILLSVKATDGSAAHHSIEPVLDRYAKTWRRQDELSAHPQLLLYDLRLNTGVSPGDLVTGVGMFGTAHITNVEVSAKPNDV